MAGSVETTNPRPEKVAVVNEVRDKIAAADAVLITEYRGLTVAELATLRSAMSAAGGEYKIYKNTLVRLAARELGLDLDEQLTGPTALAIVGTKTDGSSGDIAAVAKAVADFAKAQPLLVTKGGLLGEEILDAAAAKALASLPTASAIYSRLAGALNSGARGLAGALSGTHRGIAYVLQACIDAGADGSAPEPEAEATAEPEATTEPEAEAATEPEAEAATEPEAATDPEAATPETASDSDPASDSDQATEPEPARDAAPTEVDAASDDPEDVNPEGESADVEG